MGKLKFARTVKAAFVNEFVPEPSKTINPAEIITNLVVGKNKQVLAEHIRKPGITPFIINRLIAADKTLIGLAYQMSKRSNFNLEQLLTFYFYTIPRKKKYRVDYYNNKDKVYSANLLSIQKVFQCNLKKASEYYKILDANQLIEITNLHKHLEAANAEG